MRWAFKALLALIACKWNLSRIIAVYNAGADQQDPADVIELIYTHVKSGEIKPSRIESAYQRIIYLKNKMKT